MALNLLISIIIMEHYLVKLFRRCRLAPAEPRPARCLRQSRCERTALGMLFNSR